MLHPNRLAVLPQDVEGQVFLSVRAIVTGHLFLPYLEVFQDSIGLPATEGARIPSFAFLLGHPTRGKALFDLGMRKHNLGYSPALQPNLKAFRAESDEDAIGVLRSGGVSPGEVDRIIYSHLHWDHVGEPLAFPNAEIIVESGARQLLKDGYPTNPNGHFQELPSTHPTTFLDFVPGASSHAVLTPFATFERAIDFYDDGSLYLVQAPGHIPGHMIALARVAPNNFLCLAGDICHNRECYSPGTRIVSTENHHDVDVARETVRWLVRLHEEAANVVIVLAHEREREHEMPLFPEELGPWVIAEATKRKHNGKV